MLKTLDVLCNSCVCGSLFYLDQGGGVVFAAKSDVVGNRVAEQKHVLGDVAKS